MGCDDIHGPPAEHGPVLVTTLAIGVRGTGVGPRRSRAGRRT
ncbi:hypothetical protein [Sorangium sp. So ce388]